MKKIQIQNFTYSKTSDYSGFLSHIFTNFKNFLCWEKIKEIGARDGGGGGWNLQIVHPLPGHYVSRVLDKQKS